MAWYNDVWDFVTGQSAKTYTDLAKTGIAALSTYASYKDQKRKNELQEDAYRDYMAAAEAAGKEAEAAIDLNLTPMAISGTPTTKAQVTDYTAATGLKHGGISGLRKRYAQGPSEVEVMETDEEILTPDYLMKEEGVNIGEQVFYNTGRGDRANALMIWDQMSTPDKSIFEFDFEIFFNDGGWRDMIKGEAPNVQENMKMASAPSMGDSQNDAAMQLFNKPYDQLNEMELQIFQEEMSKYMATGGIADFRKGYARGPEEFEVEQMDEEIVTPFDLKNEEGVPIGPMAGPDWYIKRVEHLQFLGYDYEEASDIAFDDDKYYSIVGMQSAIPRSGDPEQPPVYLPKPGEDSKGIMMAAQGGRIGYAGGTGIRDYAMSMNNGNGPITKKDYIDIYLFLGYDQGTAGSLGSQHYSTGMGQDHNTQGLAHGGRTGYSNAGLASLNPMQTQEEDTEWITRKKPDFFEDLFLERTGGGGKDYMVPNEASERTFNEIFTLGDNDMAKAEKIEADRSIQGLYDQAIRILDKAWDIDQNLHEEINQAFIEAANDPDVSPANAYYTIIKKYGDILEMKKGGRVKRDNGGIMNLGGMEKDYRFSGGFVPIGEYEKKDDVPARLSKNEFVFTADAVRAAGGGSINKGAKRMYETMKNLEAQPTAKRMIA